MSAAQIAEIVAILAIFVAIAAGVGLALVFTRLRQYVRNQHVVLGSRGTVDIVEHVTSLDSKLNNVRNALEDLVLAARDHEVRIDSTLSRVGVVRFDAYQDLGGRQSTAVAFLNAKDDGVVITTVVSRDFARMYVKLIKEGTPDIPLAPEEIEAVEQARGSAPFTIRPRVEVTEGEPIEPAADEVLEPGMPFADGLPGRRRENTRELARENRRRKRMGLAPLQELPVPSARGWEEPETYAPEPMIETETVERAAPPAMSERETETGEREPERISERRRPGGRTLAERFLVERRGPVAHPATAVDDEDYDDGDGGGSR